MTIETFAAHCHRLILAGWMPCGELGEMLFKKNGEVYDLSGADLDKLDHIEEKGLFIVK